MFGQPLLATISRHLITVPFSSISATLFLVAVLHSGFVAIPDTLRSASSSKDTRAGYVQNVRAGRSAISDDDSLHFRLRIWRRWHLTTRGSSQFSANWKTLPRMGRDGWTFVHIFVAPSLPPARRSSPLMRVACVLHGDDATASTPIKRPRTGTNVFLVDSSNSLSVFYPLTLAAKADG